MLGIRHLLDQMGVNVGMTRYLDASATKGTILRRGAGKIKHLEVRQLWCQRAVDRYCIKIGGRSYSMRRWECGLEMSLESISAMDGGGVR